MKEGFKEFIFWLDECEWNYKLKENMKSSLDNNVFKRYSQLPEEYIKFLKLFVNCSNNSDTVWFLSEDDFKSSLEDGFNYNTFENISLENTFEDDDIENIRKYWNRFIPIVYSLHNGYEYYAIDTIKNSVVHGYEPIFEDNEIVANSFTEFIRKITEGKIIV